MANVRSTKKTKPKLPPVPPGFKEIAVFDPGPEIEEPSLIEQLESVIVRHVAAGFFDDRDIVAEAICSLEDQASPREIRKLAKPLLASTRAKYARLQKAWPKSTDCDRLDRAFAALERLGVLARQDYWCCATCGGDAILDEMELAAKRKAKVLGFTYFHAQSTESAIDGQGLYLEYGAITHDRASALKIGRIVLNALKDSGLKPVWNGRFGTHIQVPMKWRRRTSF